MLSSDFYKLSSISTVESLLNNDFYELSLIFVAERLSELFLS